MPSVNEVRQMDYFDKLTELRSSSAVESKERGYIFEDVGAVLAALPRSEKILEIGCGDGSAGFTEYFVSSGRKVSFLDISALAVRTLSAKLEQMGYKGFRSLSGTFSQAAPSLKGETFDVIFFGDTLHHLTREETVALLKELGPFMHADSKIVGFEPNGNWPLWRLMPKFNKEFVWEVEKNLLHCTRRGFLDKLRRAGMRMEQYTYQRVVPLSLMDSSRFFVGLNKLLTSVPGLRLLSSYTIVVGGLRNGRLAQPEFR